jgi:hypothetical protein
MSSQVDLHRECTKEINELEYPNILKLRICTTFYLADKIHYLIQRCKALTELRESDKPKLNVMQDEHLLLAFANRHPHKGMDIRKQVSNFLQGRDYAIAVGAVKVEPDDHFYCGDETDGNVRCDNQCEKCNG